MTEPTQDLSLAQTLSLIDSYAFDLGSNSAEELVKSWLDKYQANWIRLATIEALYLGRYKAISVGHILSVWLRIGTPNTHFTYEFERLICRKLPKHLNDLSDSNINKSKEPTIEPSVKPRASSHSFESQKTITLQSNFQNINSHDSSETLNLEKAFQQPQNSANNIPLISALGFSYPTDWSEFKVGNSTIHQFIPIPDVSSFFYKLKTFGEEKLERQ